MPLTPDPIGEFLDDRIAAGDMPGAVWRVEGPGGVLSEGALGQAVLVPAREPVAPDTPYDLASLTKPLATALVAVLLEERGTVELAAPVRALLPELARSPYRDATLEDLAAHRAALPAWRPLYLRAGTLVEFVEAIADEAPAGASGATLYSDLGYVLLGAAVERAASAPLDELFDRLVAAPLGLRHTGFAGRGDRFPLAAATEVGSDFERRMAGPDAGGFAWREEIPRGQVHDGNAWALGGVAGHAGLFGTAAEVAAIALEIVRPRALALSDRARSRLVRPVAGPGTRTFGFTTAVLSGAARGVVPDEAPGHTGFTGTSVWLDPGTSRIAVLLTNRVHPTVPKAEFQPIRREFHRLAFSLPAGARA